MSFTTPQFIPILISVLICWYIFPKKFRKYALLGFSYYYAYLAGGVWTVIILLCVTLFTYFGAILLSKTAYKKTAAILFSLILTALLVYGRQSAVIQQIISEITGSDRVHWSVVNMVGLSYYVLSAISYVIDIYRGKDEPDKNLFDLALWLSFFPKITAGPIERHKHFKEQMDHMPDTKFDFERIKRGLLICVRGYFYKMVLSNRMAIFVDSVHSDVANNYGFTLLITMVMFTLEIYFDFAGYSLIAFGTSHAMGIGITNNFNHPYFSASIKELWERWHISLSYWLRDYIYIPLGGSKKGKLRKYLNLIITFAVSGIWHGAGITYIIWGVLNALYQIFEEIFWNKIKIRFPKIVNIIITYLAFSFGGIFFRAESFLTSRMYIKRMLVWNPEIFTNGTLTGMGIDGKDWCVLLIAFAAALTAEIIQYKGISLYEKLQKRNIVVRWCFYYLFIFVLQIFGLYGQAFDINNFIYIKF